MPKLKENQVPSCRLHKQSRQVIVTLSGKDRLLGPFNSDESRTKYNRLVAEWVANGRRLVYRNTEGLSVSRIIAEFWARATAYYVRHDGGASRELQNFKYALGPLRRLYGATLAAEFGPLALLAVPRQFAES